MKTSIATLMAFTLFMPVSAMAQDAKTKEGWSYSVGLGGIYAPTYMGDDENRLSLVPNVRVTYEDKFFASMGEGIGYNVINTNGFKAGPIVKYDFGRDDDGDSTFAVSGDDTNDLNGLGDVDGSVEVGAYVSYEFKPVIGKLELRQGLGGHEGMVGDASLHYKGMTKISNQPLIYSFGPEITYTNDDYNDAYFSVNAAQSRASGLAQYNANDATLSYGVGGNVIIPHTPNISTMVFAKYSQLGDEIADSSLVSQRGDDNQATIGVFVNYSF